MNDTLLIFAELHAESFLRAYERCTHPADQGLGTPALICAALSAELGMKALLTKNGAPGERGHNLNTLLNALPAAEKAEIIAQVSKSFPDFSDQLSKAANAFTDWRYIYESKGPKELNIFFVGALASAINDQIVKARPAFRANNH